MIFFWTYVIYFIYPFLTLTPFTSALSLRTPSSQWVFESYSLYPPSFDFICLVSYPSQSCLHALSPRFLFYSLLASFQIPDEELFFSFLFIYHYTLYHPSVYLTVPSYALLVCLFVLPPGKKCRFLFLSYIFLFLLWTAGNLDKKQLELEDLLHGIFGLLWIGKC